MQSNEAELLAQVKKHYDLVMHLELEKNQVKIYSNFTISILWFIILLNIYKAVADKEQYKLDKENSDKNIKMILNEMNEKILKEKSIVINNVENELKSLTDLVRIFWFFQIIN